MRITKGPEIPKTDVFNKQPPVSEEDHGHAFGDIGTFNGSDIKFKRDWDKCPDCGGTGRKWLKRRRSSRLVTCECGGYDGD
jgi:hypothetical protein